ncbi:MAG: hypothetical protein II165_06250 [Bacteroidales bacterium]|nr:hypothetical protein [Bacteroidales bacterium]
MVPVLEQTAPLLVTKAQAGALTREVELAEEVEAPVAAGQVLGTLRVLAGETVLKELPLVARDAVPRLTYPQLWLRLLRAIWT